MREQCIIVILREQCIIVIIVVIIIVIIIVMIIRITLKFVINTVVWVQGTVLISNFSVLNKGQPL